MIGDNGSVITSTGHVLVSVIIPVFNSETFLKACLDSVLGQTLEGIEVICVDDHSSDSSLSILKEIGDPRLRVISFPEHRGVSAARNAGFRVSRGEYVYFMDSDDYIDKSYVECMYQCAEALKLNVVVSADYTEIMADSSISTSD